MPHCIIYHRLGQMHPAPFRVISMGASAVPAVAVAIMETCSHLIIAICQKKRIAVSIMVMTLKHCHAAYQYHQQHRYYPLHSFHLHKISKISNHVKSP